MSKLAEKFSKITDVNSLCQLFENEVVYVWVPTGNKGDGLIYLGGKTLFNKYNIKYKEVLSIKDIKSKYLFIYGGGGFNKVFHSNHDRILPYINNFEEIYILPTSFDCEYASVANFIKVLPENVLVFARELYSHAQVKELMTYPQNLRIDHDLAFFVDYSKLKKAGGKGTLISLRTDGEKVKTWKWQKVAVDIALGPHFKYMEMIDTINKYNRIVTDRAHVSISSAMLGKEVHILPNNYHKVRGIYEYSMKNKPNVTFHENDNW